VSDPTGGRATGGAAQDRVRVAPATRADVPRLHGLIRGLAVYEKLEAMVVAGEADLERALFGARPVAEALIGTLDGAPVGFALFFPTYSTFLGKPGLWLEDLFVVPEARGHGVGVALLAHLAALAVERGPGRLEWAVLDWNEPAIGFYRALGAAPLDDWTVMRLSGEPLVALARRYRA
jgi:GNAT superfamily N-acetyltransferase